MVEPSSAGPAKEFGKSLLEFFACRPLTSGCSTTNSLPYKASAENVITIQKTLQADAIKVNVGSVVPAPGVKESPMCRMQGPVKVAPGKTPAEYIRDALQEEVFLAHSYAPDASVTLSGEIRELTFSSILPAKWIIEMEVRSSVSPGYVVGVEYTFNTSWNAVDACRNVADAFGPAVQELLNKVVTHPEFPALVRQDARAQAF